MKMYKWSDIEQFRHVVMAVKRKYEFVGLDDNSNPIYDSTKSKPTLTFSGTVKLHGTCSTVVVNQNEYYAQSRERILSPTEDNAGFCFFATKNKDIIGQMANKLALDNNVDLSTHSIVLNGEWAGKGVQGKVAISELPKAWFLFGVYSIDLEGNRTYLSFDGIKSVENGIYNIKDYATYSITVDFNNPIESEPLIEKLTLEVEDECPVAKAFGVSGIGEGIVFIHSSDAGKYCFKSKGLKYSAKGNKKKVESNVDEGRVKLLLEVADKVTPEWRLEQMLQSTFNLMNGGHLDIKKFGDFIQAVVKDVMKEDLDILVSNGVEPKEINKYISTIAKEYYFQCEKDNIQLSTTDANWFVSQIENNAMPNDKLKNALAAYKCGKVDNNET